MKIARRILYVISGLAVLLSLFVVLCSVNPTLAVSVTEFFLTGKISSGSRDSSAAASFSVASASADTPIGQSTGIDDSSIYASETAGSGDTSDESKTEPEGQFQDSFPQNHTENIPPSDYVPPEKTALQTPDEVSGRNGYQPVEEETEQIDEEEAKQIQERAGYGETGEGLDFDKEFYPYYWMLDSDQQALYRQIYANSAAANAVFSPVIPVRPTQFKTAFMAVFNDHPEIFWLDSAYRGMMSGDGILVEVRLFFNKTAGDFNAARAAFESEAEEILAGARALDSDYQKEVYVHDTLLDKVRYNLMAPLNQNAYSAMVGEQTVCAGYARAYQYLLQQLGIPCYYCTGYAGENHAWNIVKLDGEYYNVDTTWDDTEPNTYDYFNKTDADFSATHVREELSVYLPACNGTLYANREQNDNDDGTDDLTPGELSPYDVSVYDIQYPVMRTLVEAGFTEQDLLSNLDDYYADCYRQIIQNGGNTEFRNVIGDRELLYACLDSYGGDAFAEGYANRIMAELNAGYIEVAVEAEELQDGRFLLYHSVVLDFG